MHMGSRDQTQTLVRADRAVSPTLYSFLVQRMWFPVRSGKRWGGEEERQVWSQGGLELTEIGLPLFPECWLEGHAPPYLAFILKHLVKMSSSPFLKASIKGLGKEG